MMMMMMMMILMTTMKLWAIKIEQTITELKMEPVERKQQKRMMQKIARIPATKQRMELKEMREELLQMEKQRTNMMQKMQELMQIEQRRKKEQMERVQVMMLIKIAIRSRMGIKQEQEMTQQAADRLVQTIA